MATPANIYNFTKQQVLETLKTSTTGLDDPEVVSRLQTFGPNKLTPKQKISALSIYLSQFKNTLTLILIGSAILILFIYFFGEKDKSDLIEAGLILAIILMITFLGFIQEYKAEKAVESLKKLLAFKAKVRRSGIDKLIDVSELVPGDIVILEEGEKVPADIRIIESYSLTINEASLTGESVPVSKIALPLANQLQISDQKNMAFSGTAIASGKGIGVVILTGDKTEIGKIAQFVSETSEGQTPIQKRLDQIGKIIGFAVLGIASVVFVFIVFFAHDFQSLSLLQRVLHSFIASVALAVAAIPEGLPAVVTISLALGTQRMLKKNALVRKLNSIETLGSTDVICSDKTGTLTKGEMTVKEIYFDQKIYSISGSGYEKTGNFTQNGKPADPKTIHTILDVGLQCNNASFDQDKVIGDPTEAALIISALKAGVNQKNQVLHEIPFSSERKKMSIVISKNNLNLLMTKGAVEEILKISTHIVKNGQAVPFSEIDKQQILASSQQMASKALRVLAFAQREIKDFSDQTKEQDIEKELIFLGLQGMIDPPRMEVSPLIQKCQQSGIRIIMITGDHIDTARAIAQEIGIKGESLNGEQLEKLTDEQLKQMVETVSIYARINPGVKMRIVEALQTNGHIVAMTGDGVNDAPALKKADIGIAMGITGTDVAKEASDMVLLDDHFNTIVSAIEEGRGIFHNIRKFVNYLLACNIGEVLVVFVAVILFQELPLSATMLLWINVVTDGLPAVALGMDPAEKDIMRYSPKQFQTQIINAKLWLEMFIFGVLLTVGTLGIYWLNLDEGLLEAKGAAFCAIVIFELLYLFIIRSGFKTRFFSNKWLLLSIAASFILQLLIIYVPFLANLFEVKHIDLFDWIYILVASLFMVVIFKLVQYLIETSSFFEKKASLPKS